VRVSTSAVPCLLFLDWFCDYTTKYLRVRGLRRAADYLLSALTQTWGRNALAIVGTCPVLVVAALPSAPTSYISEATGFSGQPVDWTISIDFSRRY